MLSNLQSESEVRESLLVIYSEPKGQGGYQWQISNDPSQGYQGHMFVEYTIANLVLYDNTMRNVILVWCMLYYVHMFYTHCTSA